MRILVTGTAGFIGSHLAHRLLAEGHDVIGVDCLSDYYDVELKKARLARLLDSKNYIHVNADISVRADIEEIFSAYKPSRVVNLAAQAGVRYASENPHIYVSSNVTGFLHILEGCRHNGVEHLVYASTSSVYGANTDMPFSEHQSTEHQLTLYAATKKANEVMAHSYSHLYGLETTGLRFFTVYGPWGRPDMALFLFTKSILEGRPIKVFNNGNHIRDFTYVDDIIEGVYRALMRGAKPNPDWKSNAPDPASSSAPYRIYNIGNSKPVSLMTYIELLEKCLGQKATKKFLPLQPGDVPNTEADITELERDLGYSPRVSVAEGVKNFVDWYQSYYGIH